MPPKKSKSSSHKPPKFIQSRIYTKQFPSNAIKFKAKDINNSLRLQYTDESEKGHCKFARAVRSLFRLLDTCSNGTIDSNDLSKTVPDNALYYLGSLFERIRREKLCITESQFIKECWLIEANSNTSDTEEFIACFLKLNDTKKISNNIVGTSRCEQRVLNSSVKLNLYNELETNIPKSSVKNDVFINENKEKSHFRNKNDAKMISSSVQTDYFQYFQDSREFLLRQECLNRPLFEELWRIEPEKCRIYHQGQYLQRVSNHEKQNQLSGLKYNSLERNFDKPFSSSVSVQPALNFLENKKPNFSFDEDIRNVLQQRFGRDSTCLPPNNSRAGFSNPIQEMRMNRSMMRSHSSNPKILTSQSPFEKNCSEMKFGEISNNNISPTIHPFNEEDRREKISTHNMSFRGMGRECFAFSATKKTTENCLTAKKDENDPIGKLSNKLEQEIRKNAERIEKSKKFAMINWAQIRS